MIILLIVACAIEQSRLQRDQPVAGPMIVSSISELRSLAVFDPTYLLGILRCKLFQSLRFEPDVPTLIF